MAGHRLVDRRRLVGPVVLLLGCALLSGAASRPAAAAAESGCELDRDLDGRTVTGPVELTGTYTDAYRVQLAVDAGTIHDTHLVDPDGDDTGSWSYRLDPSSARLSGRVEVTVRCYSVVDRYWRWSTPASIDVKVPAHQPPRVVLRSPAEGRTVTGTVPVTVKAHDAQGLESVQVRVDWGRWHAATAARGNRYVYRWAAPRGNRTHAIEARATDTDGNTTTTRTTYVDTGSGTHQPSEVQQSDRAMWVWESATAKLLGGTGARRVLGEYLDDRSLSPQRPTTIYLYADRYDGGYPLLEHPNEYRSLIEWAHHRGYRVHALLGSGSYLAPMYAYRRYHDKAVGLVESVLNYNLSSAAAERFDGVNVDIEPHGLPDWRDRPTVQKQYLDMLARLMSRKKASGQNLAVGAAIPRWLDVNPECQRINWHGTTKNCARHVIDTTDYVSLMDYRDVADGEVGIIANARNEIDYASRVGKKVLVGVETDQISASGDPEAISFQEEGRTAMEAELAKVYAAFDSAPAFLGVAVHHYDSVRVLPSEWSRDGTRWQQPIPDRAPPTVPGEPTAEVFDWQRVDLHWTRSTDDTVVDHYEVHRSTEPGFIPGRDTLARTTTSTTSKDRGLRPGTTYYWKVVAVDPAGRRSAASRPVSATTPEGTGLAPLRIDSVTFTDGDSTSTARITVVDAATGEPVRGANVFGHWEGAAGRKFSVDTGPNGAATVTTESLSAPYTVTFVPEKILAPGHYWAYSADKLHTATWNR